MPKNVVNTFGTDHVLVRLLGGCITRSVVLRPAVQKHYGGGDDDDDDDGGGEVDGGGVPIAVVMDWLCSGTSVDIKAL